MIWTVAKREVITRSRTKAFRASTAILFIAVIAGAVAVSVLTGGDDEAEAITIGLDPSVEALSSAFTETDQFEPEIVITSDPNEALRDGDLDVFFDGETLLWDAFAESGIDLYVRSTIQQAEFSRRAADLNLAPTALTELFAPVPIEEELLDGDSDEQSVRVAAAMISTVATFIILQTWGSLLTMGVIEEKSSRVVEVLLSHIPARTLLAGKILGLGILALIQMSILIVGLTIGLSLIDGIDIPEGVWAAVPVLLVTFIFGFAFYAATFAAVGSTVSRQEDAQTVQLPAMLPLFVGYGIAASSLLNGDSPVVTIASFVPFTSPVVLPFRIALVNPPLWQIALSIAILAISVPLMLNLAAKIYRTSLLKVGSRVPFLEAFRNRAEV